MSSYLFSGRCPVCGGGEFAEAQVLWKELIEAWQLTADEVRYIDRQQGCSCIQCGNNLRGMGLSAAILYHYRSTGTLRQFCENHPELSVLEINTAANLTPVFRQLAKHRLVEYPEFDMMNLGIESNCYDVVVHSDTLEHVPFPVVALSECRRVLRDEGVCIFTVPVIVDRFTRSRQGLPPSYHGLQVARSSDQIVHSEFGADIWKSVISAGFISCEIFAFEYPAALAVLAKK